MRFWKKGMEGQAKGNRNDAERVMQKDGGIGRNRRDVWRIATQATPEAHFAMMPEKLAEPMILAGCPVGGVVLDPFCGAGTTGVVAVKNGRGFVGIELSEKYTAIAQRRIADAAAQTHLFREGMNR